MAGLRRLPGARWAAPFLWLAAAAASCSDGDEARPRNLILIVADTLRADRLGCYGYEHDTSPTIDSLAARGVMYRNNHAQSSWTVPSMISLMTGLYVTQSEKVVPGYQEMLAESFQENGYVTAACVGNRVLRFRDFERGFDEFRVTQHQATMLELVERFEGWYDENEGTIDSSRGLFLWIHPMDPHDPYDETEWSRTETYVRGEELLERWRTMQTRVAEHFPEAPPVPFQKSVREMNEASRRYDGEVARLDEGVARLLEFLEAEGELADSLIVFASDHGEMLYENPSFPAEVRSRRKAGEPAGLEVLMAQGHSAPHFQEEIWNTPLILAGPGIPEGVVHEGLSANLDIYPTVCSTFGIEPPEKLHGMDLAGGEDPEREFVFGHGKSATAVLERHSGMKLVRYAPQTFLQKQGRPPLELFDLPADPTEWRDVSAEEPEQTARLMRAIQGFHRRYEREVDTTEMAQRVEDLKALGYAGDDTTPYDSDEE